jgi:adenylate cyclase
MKEILKEEEKKEIERINSKIHGSEYLSNDLKNVFDELNFLLKIDNAIIFVKSNGIQRQEFYGKAERYWKKYGGRIKKITQTAMLTNEHVIVNNLNAQIKRLLIVPIMNGEKSIGVLIVINKKINYGKDEHNTEIVRILQSQVKFALGKAKEREKLFKIFGRYLDQRQIYRMLTDKDFLKTPELIDSVVLFADISGFTKLANERGNEFSFNLLSKVLGEYSKIINKHNGIVDKFVGDQVIGIFGVVEKDDMTLNTVDTAIELRKLFAEEFKKYNIGVKIGIVKGKMLYGNLGNRHKMNLTVVGKGVNLASRLCDYACKGQVLVNQEVFDELSPKYRFGVKRFKKFKGFKRRFSIYSLI